MERKNAKFKRMIFPILFTIFIAISVETGNSFAKISKEGPDEYCNICHTGGNATDGTTNQTCIECHSSTESSTYYDLGGYRVPVVNYTGPSAPATYLAGGNFWWVKEGNEGADDTKGHNVFPGEKDDKLDMAPGGITCSSNSCHNNFHLEYTGIDPGLHGRKSCTGCHMVDDLRQPNGFHHADGGAPLELINNFPWYRFLKGHIRVTNGGVAGDGGVAGIENPNWQPNNESNSEYHNEYIGEEGEYTIDSWSLISHHTITAFCCGCHGEFHMQKNKEDSDGLWILHPSDAPLPDYGEYKDYTTYNPIAPVARPDLSNYTGPDNTKRSIIDPGNDMVTCISCHRPHGSPYPDMLRWDPDTCEGCIICHTQKSLSDGPCNKCHTMHYSQDGVPPELSLPEWSTEGPYHALLTQGCLNCHSSRTSFTGLNPKAGWSMISLPVITGNFLISELFPGEIVTYGYEKEVGYKCKIDGEGLEVGKGYWMFFYEDQNYALTGESIPKYNLPINEDGWYMIGGCTSQAQVSINAGNIVVIYGYAPGTGYERVPESENLEPGKGYWILLSGITDQAELTVKNCNEHMVKITEK